MSPSAIDNQVGCRLESCFIINSLFSFCIFVTSVLFVCHYCTLIYKRRCLEKKYSQVPLFRVYNVQVGPIAQVDELTRGGMKFHKIDKPAKLADPLLTFFAVGRPIERCKLLT